MSTTTSNKKGELVMEMMNPAHPGEILREEVLVEIGMSVSEAADRLGINRVNLSRVLNGHAALTPNLAYRLELAGVGTARVWLGMQVAYDLAQLRKATPPDVKSLRTGAPAEALTRG